MDKRRIDVEEVAEYLGIKVSTAYNWVSERQIPYVKIGRLTKFDLRKIDAWIEENSFEVVEAPVEKVEPKTEKKITKILDSTPPIKPCSQCSEVKDLDLFAIDKRSKGGRDSICKACRKKKRDEKVRDKKPLGKRFSDKLHIAEEGKKAATGKACTKCKEEKPLEEFYRNKRLKNGRATQCKICVRAKQAERDRKRKLGNPEKIQVEEKDVKKKEEGEKVPWEFGGECEVRNEKGDIIFKNGKAIGEEGEEWLRKKKLREEKENK